MRRKGDKIVMSTKICGAILAVAAVVGLCWQLLAEPAVQRQIDATVNPVVDVLEYQTFLMMQGMSNEQIQKAEESYIASQKTRVKRHRD